MQLQEKLGDVVAPDAEEVQVPEEALQEPSPIVAAVEEPVESTPASMDEIPVSQSEPKDASPLAVLQRWLSVIKNGRTNV